MARFITNFDSPFTLLSPELVRLAALGGFRSLSAAVGRFVRDERLRRIFSFQSLYAGVPPHRALAAYAVIAYMDTVAGVYFPRGGMRSLGEALTAAATKAGAELHYGRTVTRLERRGNRACRGACRRGTCPDAVVVTWTATGLPSPRRTPWRIVPLQFAPSAVVLHAGTDRTWRCSTTTPSCSARRGGVLSPRSRLGKPMSDPSLLVTQPTVTDRSLAPPGRTSPWSRPARICALGGSTGCLRPSLPGAARSSPGDRGLTGFSGLCASNGSSPARLVAHGARVRHPVRYRAHLFQTGPFRPRNLVSGIANAVLAGCGTTRGSGPADGPHLGKLARHGSPGAPRPRGHDHRFGGDGGSGNCDLHHRPPAVRRPTCTAGRPPTTGAPTIWHAHPPGSGGPRSTPLRLRALVDDVIDAPRTALPVEARAALLSEVGTELTAAWRGRTSTGGALWRTPRGGTRSAPNCSRRSCGPCGWTCPPPTMRASKTCAATCTARRGDRPACCRCSARGPLPRAAPQGAALARRSS